MDLTNNIDNNNPSQFFKKSGYTISLTSSNLEWIRFDLILEEQHSMDSVVAEHPVQDGSVISDHIQNKMRIGSFKGLVSNFDIYTAPSSSAKLLAQTIMAGKKAKKADFEAVKMTENNAQYAYESLVSLWESKQVLTIVTSLQKYDSVVITNISAMRNDESGEGQEFDIEFKEVRVVKLQTRDVEISLKPNPKGGPPGVQASPKSKKGQVTGKKK